jgi:hypothetical protein
MSPGKEDTDRKIVPCARCRKEVPVSEAKVAEAVDYIIHFCGLECYAKWAEQPEEPNACRGNTDALTPMPNAERESGTNKH